MPIGWLPDATAHGRATASAQKIACHAANLLYLFRFNSLDPPGRTGKSRTGKFGIAPWSKQKASILPMEMAGLKHLLESVRDELQSVSHQGKVADYIPELAKIDPKKFAISITNLQGETVSTESAKYERPAPVSMPRAQRRAPLPTKPRLPGPERPRTEHPETRGGAAPMPQ